MMLDPVPLTPSISYPFGVMLSGFALDIGFDAIIYLICIFVYFKKNLLGTAFSDFKSLLASKLEKHESSIGLHFIIGSISDGIGVYFLTPDYLAFYTRGPFAALVYWWILFAILLAYFQGITLFYTLRFFPVKKKLNLILGIILFSTVTNPMNFAGYWFAFFY